MSRQVAALAVVAVLAMTLRADAGPKVSRDARRFVGRVVQAIEHDDAAGFVVMVSTRGLATSDGRTTARLSRARLAAAIAEAGSVAAFLGAIGDGPWVIQAYGRRDVWLRHDEGSGIVTVIRLAFVKRRHGWAIVGVFHGEDAGGGPD